jgi:zinc transport system permease protein
VDPGDALTPPALLRALAAAVAVGLAGGLAGVLVVPRGLAFLSDGLAHAAFGGVALGLFLGASTEASLWIALPYTVVVALGIGWVRRRSRLGGDTATGVFFTSSLALGVVLLGRRPEDAPPIDVEELLFGSVATVSPGALSVLLPVSLLVLVVLGASFSRLAYATFDPELAELSGIPVARLESLLLAATALTVVAGARTVGALLVSAFVILPAATAYLLVRRPREVAAVSMALGFGASLLGLLLAQRLRLASGATVVLVMSAAFFVALAARRRADG